MLMKKFLLLCLSLMSFSLNAQFLDSTNYKGAFPADQLMWTNGWCNWNPDSTNYPPVNITVAGNITTNTTWTSNNTYLLTGAVYVDSGVTLTILPGTVIRGNDAVANSCLIVKRSSRIIAQGTATNPIVFTSNKPIGSRGLADWGGIIILGRATTNVGVGQVEGLAADPANQYGG